MVDTIGAAPPPLPPKPLSTFALWLLETMNVQSDGSSLPLNPRPLKLDANGDNVVSIGEALDFADIDRDGAVSMDELIRVMDSDGDGSVSMAEAEAFFSGEPVVTPHNTRSFREMDMNGDGFVSEFEMADVDGDSFVTDVEHENFLEQQETAADPSRTSFADWDANGDGLISMQEAADADGDTNVSISEAVMFADASPHYTNEELVEGSVIEEGTDLRSFEEMDTNDDGVITKAERADVDGDETVTEKEWLTFKDATARENNDPDLRSFDEADTDGDGEVSIFEAADGDGDGDVTYDEAKWFAEENPSVTNAQLFEAGVIDSGLNDIRSASEIDTNGDGFISADENADVDGDGQVSEIERKEADVISAELTADPDLWSFSEIDANNDNLVSYREIADTNGDGEITWDESQAFIEDNPDVPMMTLIRRGVVNSGAADPRTFAQIDRNGDGVLTQFEVKDLNGDGKIEAIEESSFKNENLIMHRDPERKSFAQADTNGDGKISVEEFADADGDGQVSLDEVNNFIDVNPDTPFTWLVSPTALNNNLFDEPLAPVVAGPDDGVPAEPRRLTGTIDQVDRVPLS